MYDILKSIFQKPLEEVEGVWSILDAPHNKELLKDEEKQYLDFFRESIELVQETPSLAAFTSKFDGMEAVYIASSDELSIFDAKLRAALYFQGKRNFQSSQSLQELSAQVLKDGITPDVEREFFKLSKNNGVAKATELSFDYESQFKLAYAERASKPDGIRTFIPEVDEFAGGITDGSLNTIAGYSGHFKSCWAVNMAYNNVFVDHRVICFMSLELSRDELLFNLLCRHSQDPKFASYGFKFIPHDKIRKGRLTPAEEEFLTNVVLPDFTNPEGGGKFLILETADFPNFSFVNLQSKMEEIDEKEGPIEVWFWDYIQIFEQVNLPELRGMSEREKTDAYTYWLLQKALDFRGRKTVQILLAQTNREGLAFASKNDGAYKSSALCLDNCNNPFRLATRFMSVYADDGMKDIGEGAVMVLKSRNGRTTTAPITVFLKPEAYWFGTSPDNLRATPDFSSISSSFAAGTEFDFGTTPL